VPIRIAVPKTTTPGEKRCAASPDTVKKLINMGAEVLIESQAGENSAIPDEAFKNAGAKISKTAAECLKNADIVLTVQAPTEEEIKDLKKGVLVIGMLAPYKNEKVIKSLSKSGAECYAMELIPRITRAQAMDVLSSQANLAGYKAVLDACEEFGRAFPMMMTAAGTIPPAKVFVMGAGVAGLQAIATAKRLGAVVSATDVRPAAKEQVESLGGSFVAVEDEEFKQAETAGGYAKEMSASYKKKQAKLIEDTIKKQDVVITTALIPGKPAPRLVTEDMVKSMPAGSVIVDLASEQGGNCELTTPGKTITAHGVTIIGHENMPSRLASSASALYAKNLLNFLGLMIDQENKALNVDYEDEIIKATMLSRDGKLVHPLFAQSNKKTSTASKPAAKKTPSKSTGGKSKAAG
jgi:NAD(P) transhydrogenase subunit alpha